MAGSSLSAEGNHCGAVAYANIQEVPEGVLTGRRRRPQACGGVHRLKEPPSGDQERQLACGGCGAGPVASDRGQSWTAVGEGAIWFVAGAYGVEWRPMVEEGCHVREGRPTATGSGRGVKPALRIPCVLLHGQELGPLLTDPAESAPGSMSQLRVRWCMTRCTFQIQNESASVRRSPLTA